MADYIYLLETRLSPAQQRAIGTIRTIARENDTTVFLTGGAVRDLTGGGSIRDLDLTLQGEAFKLKRGLENAGIEIVGENAPAQQLFLSFPGGVRVELSSAMNVSYPKPGKPKYELGNLTDDLRRRDFTANAMAISLNEGSYGLLMDPLNGVADIENREMRLVSNYGFIEDPSRLIRVSRLLSRLGWQMEERTRQRYDTAKEENYISALSAWNQGYELEEIFHEEDPVRVLRALEAEGWMQHLFPALSASKANTAALAEIAERQGQLQTQGVLAQSAAIAFPLVTAKMAAPEVEKLKAMFVRPGFVREIDTLDARTREFATRFGSKEAAAPSAAWKMLHSTEPNLVLSLSYTSKTAALQSRLKTFLIDSPTARQRIPYALLQEMRITPDLPVYGELLDKLFFELMDAKLSTPEEMKAYLEPYSPPAPPPPVNLRRARAKKEARPSRAKAKKIAVEADVLPLTVSAEEDATGVAEGLMEPGTLTGPDRGPEPTPRVPLAGKVAPEAASSAEKARIRKPAPQAANVPAISKAAAPARGGAPTAKSVAANTASKDGPPAKSATAKSAPVKGAAVKPAPAKAPAPAKQVTVKAPAKIAGIVTAAAKKAPATASKTVPAKKTAPVKKVVTAQKRSIVPAKKVGAAGKTAASAKKPAAAKGAPTKATLKSAAKKTGGKH